MPAASDAADSDAASDAAIADGPSETCKAYCQLADQVCGTGTLYTTDETCYGLCKILPAGDPNEPIGDTVACRMNELRLGQKTGEPVAYCAKAGPATNGACATNCESYCLLIAQVCPVTLPNDTCISACQGLEDTGSFSAMDNYYGDTLQCRLVHTSVATVDPTTHCPHAGLPANGPCLGADPKTIVPDCRSFCHLEMTECTGVYQQYETDAQCENVCGALDPGFADDDSENTVACRKYQSYNAIFEPILHCPDTGPGGDGTCGSTAAPSTGSTGNCESYCTLLSEACTSDFNAAFKNRAACEIDCVLLDGAGPDSGYSVAAEGNNVQCRLLHVSRALSDPNECAPAQGAAPCM